MRPYTAVALVLVLAGLIGSSHAQGTQKDVDAKLAEIDAKLTELNDLKDELLELRDSLEPGAEQASDEGGWEDKLTFKGYFQTRFNARDWGNSDFDLRRLYISLIATPNDRTTAVATWTRVGGDPYNRSNTDWVNIYVDYDWNDQWTTRAGQAQTRFGIEAAESSSKRLAVERPVMYLGEAGDPQGLFFGGLWDRGVWVTRHSGGEWEPDVTASIFNGQWRGPEANSNKAYEIDAKWTQDWGLFGASWVDGTYVNGSGVTTDRRAIAGYLRYDPVDCRWALQGEYMDARLLGSDAEGWYAQAEYDVDAKGTAFAKYERFNPNVGLAGDQYDALHLGYAHQLDANNEITIQFTQGTDGSDLTHPDRTKGTLQWQTSY